MLEAPKVSTFGWMVIDVNSCGSPQLEVKSSEHATAKRAAIPNHFRLMKTPYDGKAGFIPCT
jgi:hypothetical protein